MKKKTNWIAVFACLVVFALMALGSGSSGSGETKEIVPTNEASSSVADDDSKSKPTEATESEIDEVVESTVSIDEQVLLDQEGIVITASEYVSDAIWGDGIKLLIENNSTSDVTVGCNALIVNEYNISDLFISDIAAGKKANETMYLSSTELEAAGIDIVGQVEIYFHIYDSSSYDTIFNSDCVTIRTSEYANMDTTPNDSGTELYNDGGIRIVGKTVDENSFWGTAILLYCENNSGNNVDILVEDMSINGFMMSPYFYTTVYDGRKSIDDITIFSSDLEDNGIESIDEVELQFHISDTDSYETIADSDPITFSAK